MSLKSLKNVEKPYILFCAANVLALLFFSSFSLFTSMGASLLFGASFIGLYALAMFLYAAFGAEAENSRELRQWFYIAAVIFIGLVLRILARQIFRTEQIQDFGRAHDVYMLLPFSPADSWAGFDWYQLYYARFPAWFPHFAVTRLVYNIFGVGVRYMIFLNYALYAASAVLLYAAVKRLFSFAVAFCATALFVFNPNLIVWSVITSPDHFFIFLFCAMLYFFVRYSETAKNGAVSGFETNAESLPTCARCCRPQGLKFLCLAAAFAALTDFFKPVGLVFLIAYFCVELFMKIILQPGRTQTIKANYRNWLAFLFTFLAVFFAGHALVRAGIQRTFHIETVSSTGKFMTFAWTVDEHGRYTHDIGFAKFDRLMEEHENNLPVVMDEMSRYAGEIFRENRHLLGSILWQKTQITFGDEGVLGWAIHSGDPEYSASTHRVLGNLLWIGFTAHIFVLMLFAAAGAFSMIFEKKNRAVLVFLLTTVIGYTLVLLIGITQARYRILLYPQLSVLAAYGLHALNACGRKIFKQAFPQRL